MIHVDTHVIVWLYAGILERFPLQVKERLEKENLVISPMVVLELQFLFEIQRITQPGQIVVEDLEQRIGLQLATTPFVHVIRASGQISWTRDPFDRMIAGQALAENVPLLTADKNLLKNFSHAVWNDTER